MPVVKKCEVCSKEFSVPPVRAATAKTCSQPCRGVLIAKAYQEKRVTFRCKWCDKQLAVPKCHETRRVYCSKKCMVQGQAGSYHGVVAADGIEMMHGDGYVLERRRHHPFAVGTYVMQHRVVMEEWMRVEAPDHHFLTEIDGVKYLRREIHVHHRNRVKSDNERSNLLACTAATHKDIHAGRPIMSGTAWPVSEGEVPAVQRSFIRACEFCGKQMKVNRSSILRGGGRFCTKSCKAKRAAEQQRANRVPESNPSTTNNFSTIQGKHHDR